MPRRILATIALLSVITAGHAIAQSTSPETATRFQATRQELQEALARYEQTARSSAYSSQLRARARYEASLIRLRLDRGDYQVGDRIAVIVDGEPALSDTLVVGPDTTVTLPSGEKLPLQRVLRSEIQQRVATAMSKVVKDPTVHTETFLRIGILGAVGTQGYYLVRSDAVITDLLMTAGGPQQTADLAHVRVERDKQKIWEGEALQDAITQGRTVDQLSLRAGDVFVIPAQRTGSRVGAGTLQTLLYVIPALFGLVRLVAS